MGANVERYKAEIQRTFALVKPISTQAAAIFYPTLWEVDPTTKSLFKETDMDKQGEKLMKTLGIAVGMLNKMDTLVPILKQLGRKHVSYGVKAAMYPSVGQALLLTLEKGLGEECTPETKEAWTWVLGVISGVCIEAAKEVDPEYATPTATTASDGPEPAAAEPAAAEPAAAEPAAAEPAAAEPAVTEPAVTEPAVAEPASAEPAPAAAAPTEAPEKEAKKKDAETA